MLEKALDRAREEDVAETPEFVEESWSTQQADAFVNLVNDYLSGVGGVDSNSTDNYLVTIHVDLTALAGGDGRSAVPIETAKRLCCDGNAVVLAKDKQGEPLSIGRKTRNVSTAIKRALLAKYSHCCAFPGCHNKRFLHAHHIEHWSNGGETSVDNLMPLCTRHHPLVHEGQFRIDRDFQNRWIFIRPEGQVIPANGYLPQDVVDDDAGAEYKQSSAEDFLGVARNAVSEPPPRVYWH